MRPYFEEMTPFGKPLSDNQKESSKENVDQIREVEEQVAEAIEAVKNAGIPAEVINKRGQLTVWERIEYLIDPGTWCPLHTLYNPQFNEEGTTGRRADPTSFCIQKALQSIAHTEDIESGLMFSGHNGFMFKKDPFYSNGFVPTVGELVARIASGD